ncbi:Acyl-protein thioesterase 1, partial [Fragariocoptes setiger]
VIFLHGLGDCGESYTSMLGPIVAKHIKCVCPTAPVQPVTINFNMRMNSWFDLRGLSASDPEDDVGIKKAAKDIHNEIESLVKSGIPHDRIIVGGFSQGGALALYASLTYPKTLAGVVGLSCWIPLHKDFPGAANSANLTTPIFQGHGDADCIVPLIWGQASRDKLKTFLKDNYTFKVYNGLGHSICDQEIKDVKKFIESRLPAK